MQIQGTVIAVSLSKQLKKQGGGTYEGYELVYNDQEGQVKTIAKPVQGLKFNPAVKAALGSLNPGDEFTVTLEKNANGFNDVKGLVKGWSVAPAAPAPQGGGQAKTNNNYQGRDYETKEERSARQKYIIKQSSLTNAVAVLSVGAKTSPKPEDVLSLADVFVRYVYDAENKANIGGDKGVDNFDDFDNDITL